MSLFIRVENDKVTQVWDTPPPAGESGWGPAIEVRPPIIPHRQGYTAHTFDITKNPMEIVYGTFDISVDSRKSNMKQRAMMPYNMMNQQGRARPGQPVSDPVKLAELKAAGEAKQVLIEACTTHDELDKLV